jgi:RimJ/RimL family protein N-acetyltransferase
LALSAPQKSTRFCSDGVYEIRSNDQDANLVASRALEMFMSPYDISFSRYKSGELMATVIYQRYTEVSLLMHVASFMSHWLNRDFLWLVFNYPFVQLNCDRVFGLVHEKNEKALRLDKHLGFQIETRIRKVYPDGDQIVLVMERESCRWLNLTPKFIRAREHDGQGQRRRAGSS